jgi:hypothetical protein
LGLSSSLLCKEPWVKWWRELFLVVYTDNGDIRTFDNPNEDDLVWHRDKENRMIEVLEGENWEIQYEDELPILMFVGDEFYIPKMVFHRLHKGNDKLVIKINK